MMSSDCAQIHVFDELLESDQIGFASLRPKGRRLAERLTAIWQFQQRRFGSSAVQILRKELETHKS